MTSNFSLAIAFIISGGVNIYPAEVEAAISALDGEKTSPYSTSRIRAIWGTAVAAHVGARSG
ncbi:hypothetical protein [Nocardia sp. NPDC049707]|uniref:hypothetical protein n=1 Tax=Nocardia sp. NPDC049707 TaxID=3154735 RepID=UPI003415E73A